MRRLLLIIALVLITSLPLRSQQGNTVLILFPGVPTGTCSFNMVSVDNATGDFYDCDSTGNWNKVGPGAAGAVDWDSINSPTAGNQSLAMANFLTDWVFGAATGAGLQMFDLRDTTGNTGTGYVLSVSTTGTSAAKAIRITDGGLVNGVEMSTAAVLQAIGTGSILADDLQTNTIGSLTDFDPNLCAATQILERQGSVWACTATPSGAAHAILSATHTDTTAAAVVRGDLMTGQTATPEWTRLAVGGANDILGTDGTDAAWEAATGTASPVRANNPLFPDRVRFTAIAGPAHSSGQLFYDSGDEAMAFHNNEADITLQIGQEMWVRVRNESGSTITNGQVVYIDGLASGLPRIALARADVAATAEAVGLATHDIETASTGFVTAYGLVRDFDTSSFTLADRVYLSASVAGAITNTAPSDPNFVVPIGIITEVNVSTGDVFVALGAPRPIGGAGILISGNTFSTLSSEETFLVSGALSCGSNTAGKMQTHTTPLQYCDNAATPLLRLAAYAASDGDALAGDSATNFFDTGTLEDARLSTNVALASDTLDFFSATTSAQFLGVISDATGSTLVVGSDSPVFSTLVTVPQEVQWNEAAGDPACVAGEFWIAANSSTNIFRKCQNGSLSNLDTSGAVRWDEITDPTAVTIWNSNAVAELFQVNATAAYGATDIVFDIEQLTGNPVAGSKLFQVSAADPDILLFQAGATNGVQITQPGALTAIGSGTITATDLAADALDALTEIAGTLCGTTQILEDQGASWACINTPSGGAVTLDAITAAAGSASINNGDNDIVWNSSLTTASRSFFTFGENVAAVATGDPIIVNINTLTGSTAHPFQVTARGTANGWRTGATDGILIALGTGGLDWPALLNYPTACSAQFVRAILDTPTCETVVAADVDETTFTAITWLAGTDSTWAWNTTGGTSPVMSFTGSNINISTGGLQVGGTAVGLAGPCTGQFVTDVNSASAPTCATVTSAETDETTFTGVTWGANADFVWNFNTVGGANPDSVLNFNSANINVSTGTLSVAGNLVVDLVDVPNAAGDISGDYSAGLTIDAGAVASAELATANKTFDKSINIIDPVTGDDDKVQWFHGKAVTYGSVNCSTDAGTVTIDMDHRVLTTPNTVGTDILTGTIVCDTNNQADSGFADATIPANVPVNLSITAVSGATAVRIHIVGTED